MATRRSGGLIQRNTGSKVRVENNVDHQVVESPDQNLEEEESADKETRLTLMEEVLLLGLKDREVIFLNQPLKCFKQMFQNMVVFFKNGFVDQKVSRLLQEVCTLHLASPGPGLTAREHLGEE